MNCIEQAKKIYTICVESASAKSLLTYQDVLAALGYKLCGGHVIRYGLELAWIACVDFGLPSITSIIVNKQTQKPTASGYPIETWSDDVDAVFNFTIWPDVEEIDWIYVWNNRSLLSDLHGTRGYWNKIEQ